MPRSATKICYDPKLPRFATSVVPCGVSLPDVMKGSTPCSARRPVMPIGTVAGAKTEEGSFVFRRDPYQRNLTVSATSYKVP